MATLQELAQEMSRSFEDATRPDGSRFIRLRDGSPEWMSSVVMESHGGLLPDDWRYATCAAACEWIAERIADTGDEDAAEDASEFADSTVPIYTADLTAWLGSHCSRPGYVDEAAEEFGPAEDVLAAIGRGMYLEASEVYGATLAALQSRADGEPDDDGEEV